MPQMSPIIWPMVISILMLSIMLIKSNMPKLTETSKINQKQINKTKTWKW